MDAPADLGATSDEELQALARAAGVLAEDGPCLAAMKPPGLPTEAPAGADSLVVRVKNYLRAKYHKTGEVYLGVPHRLDRPASGVLVFARNSKAAARLADEFRERRTQKVYWALLEAPPAPTAGAYVDLVEKVPNEPRGRVVPAGVTPSADAKSAELRYRYLKEVMLPDGPAYWVAMEPLTGRFHQIRLQWGFRGCPIVGDRLYGSTRPWPEDAIALHARRLVVRHPIRFDDWSNTAPPPPEWPDLPFDFSQ
ncbi:MAG: RluA family pseudouridine synthase, partial [Planctomycetia bacterium]